MCGIAGVAGFDGRPVALDPVRRMCAALRHRGPDDEGYHASRHVALGMRRLAIIDLAGGHQPVRNEDGCVWAVLNGEIYNYRELRADLERRGHVFATAGDTETIVHQYEEDGPACVRKLRGMFALAVWDERRRTLLLARDRVGIKPLYWCWQGGRLRFASELKALLALTDLPRRIDWRSLQHLLTFLYTPADASIIEGVHKLEPGCTLQLAPGREPVIERYWDVRFAPEEGLDEAERVARLRALLEESVRLHLVSDVPVGAFLSGGVDSSAVVATMARLTSRPVRTFSIGFHEEDYSELRWARLVARRFGTEHHELVLTPDVLDVIDDLVWHLDEPFGDSSAIPTYMVSRLAAGRVTVVLSGDGGDELFAGYDRYAVESRERRRAALVPRPLRRALGLLAAALPLDTRGREFLRHGALDGADRYLDALALFPAHEQRGLLTPEAARRMADPTVVDETRRLLARPELHWLSALQDLDLRRYLPLDILTKVDRMSMAHSIEARVPLLDHRLIEYAATLPASLQLRRGGGKYLFKRALRGLVPDEVLDRPKRGFAVPLGRWFRGRLGNYVRDLLLCETARRRGIFAPAGVERLLARHAAGRDLDLRIWTLITFELWCRQFLDRAPTRALAAPPPAGPAAARDGAAGRT